MKNGKKIYIIYHSGSYGSWIRWLIDYSNDLGHRTKFIPLDPLLADGSSHNLVRNSTEHPGGLTNTLKTLDEEVDEDCGYRIYRTIPIIDQSIKIDEFLETLAKNKNPQDKIIYIDVDGKHNKELTFLNNGYKAELNKSFEDAVSHKITQWSADKSSFFELEKWQQRELISYWYEEMIISLTESPSKKHDALIIPLSHVYNMESVALAKMLVDYCELPFRNGISEHLCQIHGKMMSLQKAPQVLKAIYDVISAIINGQNIDIQDLSLFGEAMVQKKLRDHGKEIQCYGLNVFPSNTNDLLSLIK